VGKKKRVRPLAICVFRSGDRILVAEGYDPVKGEVFYRPLGGAIKFGEYSREALIRELREEIGAEITGLRYLGTLENIFTFNGEPGHEIVLVYEGAFVDESIYTRDSIEGHEGHRDLVFKAVWRSLSDFQANRPPLYPPGLYELLMSAPVVRERSECV